MELKQRKDRRINELRAGRHNLPLMAMDVKGKTKGLLYSALVSQTFHNDSESRLEAVYVFPLPPKAAVHSFLVKVGERTIRGKVDERARARKSYEEAKQSGRRAALLEEERTDIFTLTVGNIAPNEEICVQFELSGYLESFGSELRLRFPLVVGEVFIPKGQVPDASRIAPPRLDLDAPNPVRLSLEFEVDPCGLKLESIGSSCHFAQIKRADNLFYVSLVPGFERLTRAFVLEMELVPKTLQTSLLIDEVNKVFALSVVPPSGVTPTLKRDVVILLDHSYSMNGWNIVAAKRAVLRIIEGLNEADRFSLLCFCGKTTDIDSSQPLLIADLFHKQMASDFLELIVAKGGTQMLPALQKAQEKLPAFPGRHRHIIMITDGEVGNEDAILQTCDEEITISTVGIGHTISEGILQRMASRTGGLCTLIPSESRIEGDLMQLHRSWGQPVCLSLSLDGEDESQRAPKFWDVWPDVTATFFGRYDQLSRTPTLSGDLPTGEKFQQKLTKVVADDPVIFRSWARSRILDLQDLYQGGKCKASEIIELSLFAQVLSKFTAFVAIDNGQKVDLSLPQRRVVQAVEQTLSNSPRAARMPGSVSAASLPPIPEVPERGETLIEEDRADKVRRLLREDHLLVIETTHNRAALESCMEATDEVLRTVSVLMLESKIPSSKLAPWKLFLASLIDYRHALDEIVAGGEWRVAKALRRELTKLAAELT